MTKEEILQAFDIQYNNISSDASPGFNTYEISYYMTKAHREIVNNYYNGTAKGDSIDTKEKVRSLLSRYIKTISDSEITRSITDRGLGLERAQIRLSNDVWQLLRESIVLQEGGELLIKPVSYDHLLVIMEDPFKRPNLYKAWRLDTQGPEKPEEITDTESPNDGSYYRYVDILFSSKLKGNVDTYRYTYLMLPEAIVLDNFLDTYGPGFAIDGLTTVQIPATISRFLWDLIINRAVELAVKDYKENTLATQATLNQRVE